MRMSLLPIVLVLLIATPLMAAESKASSVEIGALYERVRLNLERLKSVSYKAHVTRVQHVDVVPDAQLPHQKPFKLVYDLEFSADGNLFYSRTKFTGLDGEDMDQEFAYNGEHYQRFEEKNGLLELTRNLRIEMPTQALMVQPIVYPFAFAFGDKDQLDYPVLLNTGTWDRLIPDSTLVGQEIVKGMECDVVTVNRTRNGMLHEYRVFFARPLDGYPIRMALETPVATSVIETDARRFNTERGSVIAPMRIEQRDSRPDGTLVVSHDTEIIPETLKVNVALDRSIFTIDKERAWNGVLDEDQNIFTVSESASRPGEVKDDSSRYFWLVLINVSAVAVIAGLLIWRRRQTRSRNV